MAQYIKNDINFHGAKSKTRTVEKHNSKKQSSEESQDDSGWGSVSSNTGGASNWEDGWGDVPNNSSVSNGTWGQDRLVTGVSQRNRKFQSSKGQKSVYVPIQQLPNWDEVEKEFPSLGSRRAPVVNVWAKRKEKYEENKAIEPSNQTEEELMIQKAIELSKMEAKQEEEKRRQLEEEYRLQSQLLEANPDMFDEFRPVSETYGAAVSEFDDHPYDYKEIPEEFSDGEIFHDAVDHEGGWGSSNGESAKQESFIKGGRKTRSSKNNDFPQLKQILPAPQVDTTIEKSSYGGARPKISKVVDMFGGWGSLPSSKTSNWDTVEAKPVSKTSNWDMGEEKHASKTSNWDTVEAKPASKTSNWDMGEEKHASKLSNCDNFELKPVSKTSNWDMGEEKHASKLSNCDNFDLKPASMTSNWDGFETEDTKSSLSSVKAMPAGVSVQRHNSKDYIDKSNWEKNTVEFTETVEKWDAISYTEENKSTTCDNVELNSESKEKDFSTNQKKGDFVSKSQRKNPALKLDFETHLENKTALPDKDKKQAVASFEEEHNSELYTNNTEIVPENDMFGNYTNSSKLSQDVSHKASENHAKTKTEVRKYGSKCSDSHRSVEGDYAFLINNIESNYTVPEEKSNIKSTLSFSETKQYQSEIPQVSSQTNSTYIVNNLENKHSLSTVQTVLEDPSFPISKALENETTDSFGNFLQRDLTDAFNDVNVTSPSFGVKPNSSNPLFMGDTSNNDAPTFGLFPSNAHVSGLSMNNDGSNPIDPPKPVPIPTPEFINPSFLLQPNPMMTPFMNPSLMMGMNPMLMQQMMLFSNPFFVKQLQHMDMYYKSMGMPLMTGMPLYPQPMAVPPFGPLSNGHTSIESSFTENEMTDPIPPPKQRPNTLPSQPPGLDTSLLLPEVSPDAERPEEDEFWFKDYMSIGDASSFIPPPKSTQANTSTNIAEVPVGPNIDMTAFGSLSLSQPKVSENINNEDLPVGQFLSQPKSTQNRSNEGFPVGQNIAPISEPLSQKACDRSNMSPEQTVPYVTGWGDLEEDTSSKPQKVLAWNDDVDGWGNNNPTINSTKSMRNSSRYVPEKKTGDRQPASRPYLGRHKT